MMGERSSDPVLHALDRLERALQDNQARNTMMQERISALREQRARGRSWSEIVHDEGHPLIVEIITTSRAALEDAGAILRRNQARALHDEGLTMDRIAQLFGVTRQRVSALLAAERMRNGGGRERTPV